MSEVTSPSVKTVLLFLPLLRRLLREIQESLSSNRVEKHSLAHFVERVCKMFENIFVPERYLTFAKGCEKTFTAKFTLQAHYRHVSQTEKKHFACIICTMKFDSIVHLARQSLSHKSC
ncbi:hypothetical protein AVEN_121285-1 [Araneus ventricosus]|uniref:C2H2-type domain-containing protein n=1 Tax=Araneus ventricosus TaxID=182803 RepID=A0A4Y2SMH6_ARAVE|nr:hypothetical protein AVEN_121285-1 [Araneus ventricosus]